MGLQSSGPITTEGYYLECHQGPQKTTLQDDFPSVVVRTHTDRFTTRPTCSNLAEELHPIDTFWSLNTCLLSTCHFLNKTEQKVSNKCLAWGHEADAQDGNDGSLRERLSRQQACSLLWCAPLCNTARSSVEVSPCFCINSSYTTPITMSRTNLYLHKLNEHHCCVTLQTKCFRRKCAFTKPTLPSKTDC